MSITRLWKPIRPELTELAECLSLCFWVDLDHVFARFSVCQLAEWLCTPGGSPGSAQLLGLPEPFPREQPISEQVQKPSNLKRIWAWAVTMCVEQSGMWELDL